MACTPHDRVDTPSTRTCRILRLAPPRAVDLRDSAHGSCRIGQKKTVFVNRYVSRGTIEEKVMDLEKRKSALISGVMDDGDAFDGGLTADDIRALID